MLNVLLEAEPLSQVVFVHDYIQLILQDTCFNLCNRVTVHRDGCTLGLRTLALRTSSGALSASAWRTRRAKRVGSVP